MRATSVALLGGDKTPIGRPLSFSVEIAVAICERLALGQGLNEICRDPAMPHRSTVFRWLAAHEDFRSQYVQARELQAEALGDEILEIADDARNDWMERGREGEAPAANYEHIARSKVRIDARKWLMSKLAPKKYGDRITQEIGGLDGGPIQVREVSDLDRAKALALLVNKMKARGDDTPSL